MAIYRPPKPRWPLAIAVGIAGLVTGLGAGMALGSSDPDPAAAASILKTNLVSAAGSLEVAAIEYTEAVSGGRVVSEAEYSGALDALRSSRSKYSAVRSALSSLFPRQVESIDSLYDEAEDLMSARADATEVATLLEDLQLVLKG